MGLNVSVLTLYPQMFPGPLSHSLSGKALENNQWSLDIVNIRDFATDKHASVDDKPTGGGAGMVLRADVLAKALDSLGASYGGDNVPRLLLSPRGVPLNQRRVRELSTAQHMVLVCGRFEGVDERIIEGRNLEEVSIGDYILSGGEMAAMVLLDSIVRLLPQTLGNDTSICEESFENGLLEYPQYTQPQNWEGREIPDILKSGDHGKIREWRHRQSLALTQSRRPDLLGE